MDTRQQMVLRRNHRLLVNTVDLGRSSVLDTLVGEELVSGGEQEDILSRVTPRDQVTRLLFVLKRREGSYGRFLHALERDYCFLAKKLGACEREEPPIPGREKVACAHCQLQENLIPNDVSHFLYEEGVITDDDLEELNNKNTSRPEQIQKLFCLLQRDSNPTEVYEKFRQSLESKYSYILAQSNVTDLNGFLVCGCSGLRGQEHFDTGQRVAISSAERNGRPLLFTAAGDDFVSCKVNPGEAVLTRQPQEHSDDEGTPPVRCIPQVSAKVSADIETLCHSRFVGKSNSRKLRRRRRISYDEPDSVIAPSEEQTPACDAVYQHVGRSLPNDRKLMRKCSKLWDHLFSLREKGDWTMFDLVTSKAFETFADCPDIQVLLWRSEMCISTFYKTDQTKALMTYEKAMQLIPKTSMPSWHLARILPLRVEICTRNKQFEEANSLLEQAHQAMATLSPCLSTGAVYFFEANYLGTFLRCSGSGTRKAESISNRVKTCFLTAIDHYKQEKAFAIQSFLNQVYLFYALFTLGVDFKTVQYLPAGRERRSGDVERADHYLRLFEDSCWDMSTTWSRMLFYIGRGEQHKLQNNLKRSLEYFGLARTFSEQGGFQEHLEFIDQNLTLVTERLEEHDRILALKQKSANDIIQSLLDSSSEDSGSGNNS